MLWLSAVCFAMGRACVSSNQWASTHRRAQLILQVVYIRIVYTQRGSVKVWQVTGSLLLFVMVCNVLCYRLSGGVLCVPGLCPELLTQCVCCVRDNRCTVYLGTLVVARWHLVTVGPGMTGVSFPVRVQVPW